MADTGMQWLITDVPEAINNAGDFEPWAKVYTNWEMLDFGRRCCAAALASRPAEVDDKRQQDLIDVFDLTWNVAVESAAFYVDGHCADGAHHVEHILELVPPKIVVGGITIAEVRARRAKADAELWETAMSHAANYVENHCIDGEDHASHMMSMKRPEFGAAPSHTTNKEK